MTKEADGPDQSVELRKRAEESLLQSEERLKMALFAAGMDAFQFCPATDEVHRVGTVTRDWQLPPHGRGSDYLALVHPDDLERLSVKLKELTPAQPSYTQEYRLRKPDRSYHWIVDSAEAHFDALGRLQLISGVSADITDRKLAEEKLRKSEERYRVLAEQSLQALAVLRGGRPVFVYVNPKWTEIFGYTAEEALSLDPEQIWNLVNPDDRAMVRQRHHDRVTGKSVVPIYEFRIVRKDDSTRWVQVFANRIDSGDEPSIQAVYVDITDRKQAEAEKERLEAQNRQLQKAESLGRMAGAIAHHFNNKLGVVIGNLEMAMIDLSMGELPVKRLKAAMTAANRAAEVSGQMLTYLGHSFDKRELLDLSNACRFSLPMLRAAIPENVVLDHNLPSLGPAVRANLNQIQQVLTSLISNAWEAIGKGRGSIHLRVRTVSPADIPAMNRHPVDWQPDNDPYACLELADTGSGIPDEDLEKLFDPFFSTKFTGRGLGLSVVLGIVRAHAGAVTVESEPGRGSVFRVFFPVSVQKVACRPDKAAQVPEIEKGGTVLLVEAEVTLRNMATMMITRLGFRVLVAKDGVEALEVFRQHQDEIRCVLCDLTMPGMDGWETLAALRALRPDLPVILASGHDEAQVMQGDHPELPQAFLHKPYRMADVQAALGAAVKRSRLSK